MHQGLEHMKQSYETNDKISSLVNTPQSVALSKLFPRNHSLEMSPVKHKENVHITNVQNTSNLPLKNKNFLDEESF